MLGSFSIKQEVKDSWSWTLADDGMFDVKKLRLLLDKVQLGDRIAEEDQTICKKLIPGKVNVFMWRAWKGRLPVRVELDKRGIDLHTILCPLCLDAAENVDHVLARCKVILNLWSRLLERWGIEDKQFVDRKEILRFKGLRGWKKKTREYWEATVWMFAYLACNYRNSVVFKGKKASCAEIFSEFQLKSYMWIKARSKRKNLSWFWWHNDPVFCSM